MLNDRIHLTRNFQYKNGASLEFIFKRALFSDYWYSPIRTIRLFVTRMTDKRSLDFQYPNKQKQGIGAHLYRRRRPKQYKFITVNHTCVSRCAVNIAPSGSSFLRSKLRRDALNPQRDSSGIGSVFFFYLSWYFGIWVSVSEGSHKNALN